MDEDMALDEQAELSDDEDIGSAHIPTVNLRQGWWKPLEEDDLLRQNPLGRFCHLIRLFHRITGHQLWRLIIHLLLKTRFSRRPVTWPHL
uniref:Uncharacterized protein n=1 Tax=Tanacetum cinerariifolium TaxID=118510 RepID=A0A699V5H8_TANCI|nr:hypothetical protein [Tanacetum cinerariifolium]